MNQAPSKTFSAPRRFVIDETQGREASVLRAFSKAALTGEYKEVFIFGPTSWFSTDGKAIENDGLRSPTTDDFPTNER